jgi:uncharacterized protein YaiI (UPF0178 family)
VSRVLHVYVDADACPVKQEVYRVAGRHGLSVTLVAGAWMRIPSDSRVSLEVVGGDPDAADDWIAGRTEPDDIVVTQDVPLASRCVERGSVVLSPTGRRFTPDNIGDALATRNLMTDLRGMGEVTGGSPPLLRAGSLPLPAGTRTGDPGDPAAKAGPCSGPVTERVTGLPRKRTVLRTSRPASPSINS